MKVKKLICYKEDGTKLFTASEKSKSETVFQSKNSLDIKFFTSFPSDDDLEYYYCDAIDFDDVLHEKIQMCWIAWPRSTSDIETNGALWTGAGKGSTSEMYVFTSFTAFATQQESKGKVLQGIIAPREDSSYSILLNCKVPS